MNVIFIYCIIKTPKTTSMTLNTRISVTVTAVQQPVIVHVESNVETAIPQLTWIRFISTLKTWYKNQLQMKLNGEVIFPA